MNTELLEVMIEKRKEGMNMKGPGRLVSVNDTEIHVYSIPYSVTSKQGTVVFLSGSAPFIPAAHSLSGLEAIYWAQKYPDEIPTIIGLDMAVPSVYNKMELPRLFNLQVKIGHLLRNPIARSMVKQHPAVKNNLLDENEQSAMKYIISNQLLSKNMIDEINHVKENALKVASGKCPTVPLLCYLSNDKANLKRIPTWGENPS